MSIKSLDTLRLELPVQQLQRKALRQVRKHKRHLRRTQSNFLAKARQQYYLTDAFTDSRRALSQNEDIALACLIVLAVMSYSATSTLAAVFYQFMQAAHLLSTISGANIVILMTMAFGVVAVSMTWLLSLLQNALSIALLEGANRKQNRSLRLTFRRSLRFAHQTAVAWIALLATALVPPAIVMLITSLIVFFAQPTLTISLVSLISMGIICTGWIVTLMANYSLVPYVLLFEKKVTWHTALQRSRQLVKSKGRVFIIGSYVVLALVLMAIYYLTQLIENVSNFSYLFLFLSVFVVAAHNACLTMLYRKRKLARK
jgi:hypothetical protein